jgi:NADH dehydrogenase
MSDRPNRVFVSGASGFVGTNVVEALVDRGINVSALVNRSPVEVESDRVETTRGGLFDAEALRSAMAGCDAAIHLVGIIFERPSQSVTFERIHVEGTRAVLEAAKVAGVRRYVHMSALGTRQDAVSAYHRTKWQAEGLVRASGLDWTVFRPGLIHGPRGEFMQQAAAWARGKALPFLFMPYFGKGLIGTGGSGLLQPVYVKDVARAFVDAITNDKAVSKLYDLAGPDRMTWPQMHKLISRHVRGRAKAAVPIPTWYAAMLTRIAPASWLPFNAAQVQMAREDNVGDTTAFCSDFGSDLTPMDAALEGYAQAL